MARPQFYWAGVPAPTARLPRLANARAARDFFRARLAGLPHERLCVAHLDRDGCVLGETAVDGEPAHARIPLRRIMADALGHGAKAMLLAHNHPGGAAQASRGDLETTRRVADMADALGIQLRDHLILLPDGRALSLRAQGLL